MPVTKTKTEVVTVPEIADLPIDDDSRAELDSLCAAYRSVQAQIGPLEKTKEAVKKVLTPLAVSLNLPVRVLGKGWDLRATKRTTTTINTDKLRMTLLRVGWTSDQVTTLLADCTDEHVSVSWSVFDRKADEEGVMRNET